MTTGMKKTGKGMPVEAVCVAQSCEISSTALEKNNDEKTAPSTATPSRSCRKAPLGKKAVKKST
nr:hypothetical protein [Syntrophothermus sp.]